MRTLYNSDQISYLKELEINGSPTKSLKIICEDGVIFCDRFLFVLWSKTWRKIFDPNEETSVLICPELKKGIIELVLTVLKTGQSKGLENEFENFFDTVLDIFHDLPNGFSNIETSEKSLEKRAKTLIARRNTFKELQLNGHVCEFCLSLFASRQAKKKHIEYYHTNQSLFNCSICHASFRTREGLASHEKAKHRESQGDFICTICDVKFENESSLKRHMKIIDHDALTKISYVCAKCDKIFKTRRTLREHKRKLGHNVDTKEGKEQEKEKKFKKMNKCTEEDCAFETSRPDSLLRHQRLVHGMFRKDFQAVNNTLADGGKWTCSKCGKTFTSVSEVRTHVIQCEEIRCEFCNKTYSLKHHLKRHIEKKHSAYTCEKCKKRFKNGWLLREHIVDKICDK